MLFDLRARGRRRAIQAIYLTLAILMGGGLVLFGIGGNVDGGLIDAFKNDAQRADDDTFVKRAEAAERRAAANPKDVKALADAARARFQVAGQGENFDSTRQVFTDKGLVELRKSEAAYDKYVALVGDKVDVNLASLMVQAFVGLEKFDKAASATEVVAEEKKTFQLYVAAGDVRLRRGPDPQGRPRRRARYRARAQGRQRAGQGPARGREVAGRPGGGPVGHAAVVARVEAAVALSARSLPFPASPL